MKNVFEDRQTGDPQKDAILADNERAISTVDQAMAYGDMKKSGMAFYYTDSALTGVYYYAKDNIARKTAWAGSLRYFDRQVRVFDKTSAAVTYCADESNANVKDLKTDKVNVVETSPDSYVYYSTSVRKNSDGVWQISKLDEDRGAKRCQP
ncbi:hypothetical protein [Streptomyces sp. NPDC057002]|uniref:hypothetical protein n=1 Tax=Streptomyces sp. NPDC057002 TaxID=3345992 RepID=UPI00362C29D4